MYVCGGGVVVLVRLIGRLLTTVYLLLGTRHSLTGCLTPYVPMRLTGPTPSLSSFRTTLRTYYRGAVHTHRVLLVGLVLLFSQPLVRLTSALRISSKLTLLSLSRSYLRGVV